MNIKPKLSDFILKRDIEDLINDQLKPYFKVKNGESSAGKAENLSLLNEFATILKSKLNSIKEPLSWTKVNV